MFQNKKNVTTGVKCWTEDGSSIAGGFGAVERVKKINNQTELRKDTRAGQDKPQELMKDTDACQEL
jgi:hypothetical protein